MGQPQKPIACEQQIYTLGRILQSLREQDSVDALIGTTIYYLQEQFDYKLIWVALYDRVEHILYGKGGITPSHDLTSLKQRLVLSSGDLLEQVVIEQRPLGVADLRAELRVQGWQETALQFNIQGTIILPIRSKDRCLGVVLLGSCRWGYVLDGEEKARLSIILGELGVLLGYQELDLLFKETKHLDEPLLRLLENLRIFNNLEQKLELVVNATHEFVTPSRTTIYWYERDGRFFWRRNQSHKRSHTSGVSKITVEELNDFYFALSVNQIVCIGEGRSSLKSHFTAKLLQSLQVRSLLAAPITWEKDLLGFLAVESKEPRIWMETDKNFIRSAAGLISLTIPTDNVESSIQLIRQEAQLKSQVAQVIYSSDDVEYVLNQCATKVLSQLAAKCFIVLQYNPEQNNYQIFYHQSYNSNVISGTFEPLKDIDWQLLQRQEVAVGIENLEEDLRFFNWRSLLMVIGVRSLLICNCQQTKAPESLLLIGKDKTYSWTTQEKELLHIVAQQISVVIRQYQLYEVTQQQQQILHSFQKCLRILEQTQKIASKEEYLELTALKQIAFVLKCPLVILISWSPGQRHGKIIPGVIANTRFAIAVDTVIPLQVESIVQWALNKDGLLNLKVNDLPVDTRKWLHGSAIGQILVMALHTATDFEPTGVVVIADHIDRHWSEQSLEATETLICQLAWSRRQGQINQILQKKTEDLQQINWYKHRSLLDIQKTITSLLSQISNLGIPNSELQQMRYQQLLRQLDHTASLITKLVKQEQWHLQMSEETIPITGLLKRSLERVDSFLKQQKLWVGVHGLGQEIPETENYSIAQSNIAISGDSSKIELILYELLLTAIERSLTGGRIDIWCRRIDASSLEVSITDNGIIKPQLLAELQQDTAKDILAPSILDQPPGSYLVICQNLMQQLKGELHFYQLPDGRIVSRLLLPLDNDLS